MTPDDALNACATLAAGVPFFSVNDDGRIRHASPGARLLDGCALQIGEARVRITGRRLLDPLPAVLRRSVRDHRATIHQADGASTPVVVHAQPVSDSDLLLLRLDPVPDRAGPVETRPLRAPLELPGATTFFGMWTRSPEMKTLFRTIQRVAESDVTVLVRGESGTGKEHVARAVHGLSPRSRKPFVAINCATLSPGLLESELFGHVKGAFTGAVRDHTGLFGQANGGTVFLDEVAELPPPVQSKLLRVLQEQTFIPVGGTRAVEVDVRVISATHQSLRAAVAEGRFRDDLMYRLRVVPLFLPPLRDRRGDIELLVSHFMARQAEQPGRHRFARISPEALRALLDHPWAGNVRELLNVVEYACVVGTGDVLGLTDLPPEFRNDAPSGVRLAPGSPPPTIPARGRQARDAEIDRIVAAMTEADGRKGKAAELLGMHRTTLWRKLREYGLE